MVTTLLVPLVTNFPEICAFIIGFSFTVWTKSPRKNAETSNRMLTKFVSIHMNYVLLLLLLCLPKYLVL